MEARSHLTPVGSLDGEEGGGGRGEGGEVKAREDGEPTAPCSVVDGEGPVRGARSPYGDRPRQLEPVGKGDQLADNNERTDTERSILFTDPNPT